MPSLIHRRKTCRLCQSENVELVFQLAASPIGDAYVTADKVAQVQERYPIDTFLCHNCGLSQLLDVLSPDVLYGDYIYVTSSSLGLAEHFQRYADEVVARIHPPAGALMVDIGSNDGTLLQCFKRHKMKVLGVEPAPEIAKHANESGVPTLNAFFSPETSRQIRKEHGPASVITANNVFANVDDLVSLTEGIRDLLAPDGVFVCESYYMADVIDNMVFDFIYHEHISSFAVRPLKLFFDRMGLQLIDVRRIPTKGGSLRYTVQRAGGPRPVSPVVEQMIAEEWKKGLYDPKTFHAYNSKINVLKKQTLDLLRNAKKQGKTIAGFGASITVTTLIYHFELAGLIDYLVDDNLAKQGRFSPGLHLPVYSPEALYEKKPDIAVVLAWRYVEPILKKHGRFLSQGGQFIVPVPEVKTISDKD